MKTPPWRSSRFDSQDEDPLGPLANFIDIMLVFACGLIAALAALSPDLINHLTAAKNIEKGRELSKIPPGLKNLQGSGEGYESLGNVFRDPKTGKLYLINKTKPQQNEFKIKQ
ncbi:MAG: hypothetical protein F3743_02735 [Nitrospinae bacterium]|nr:hypothetical protein [Nitrospinota bacterium]MZH04302.1 hypothetical protein [Nitrospinota bacterium]MZH14476.1 hypothetical protein [Nitrospinota bacterium]